MFPSLDDLGRQLKAKIATDAYDDAHGCDQFAVASKVLYETAVNLNTGYPCARRYMLSSINDWLYALQTSIPHFSRSSLYLCRKRHVISRPSDVRVDMSRRSRLKKQYGISYFQLDIAEIQMAEAKLYLYVVIARTKKQTILNVNIVPFCKPTQVADRASRIGSSPASQCRGGSSIFT